MREEGGTREQMSSLERLKIRRSDAPNLNGLTIKEVHFPCPCPVLEPVTASVPRNTRNTAYICCMKRMHKGMVINRLHPKPLRTYLGLSKIRGTFLGVPIIRMIVFGDLYSGPLILENYHLRHKT